MISNTVCDGWRKISYYGWEGLGHGGEFRRHYGASVLTNALYGPGFLRATPSSVPDWDSYALHTGADSSFDPARCRRSDLCQTSVHTAPPHSYAVTSYHPATRDLCTHDRPATVLHTPAAPCAKERELRSASRHHHLWARTPPQDEHNKPCIDS